ncbi:baseplate J/gp47 family protein [Heyndrickxia coagulans]|uniref:baseplate J/gp47 family protein n=1 Tax=Heyndrickxia coagulans TaxID=1398 RepID=UPI002E219649|nr:baseplate J/gp47 family protein [Heyndrickxia coagulans]
MLDRNGFSKETYSDLIDEMEAKAKELFGEDINTKAYTPLGIILRIFAWFLSILWDNNERVYNSRFIKKAEGIQLDYHGGNRNLPREPATNSYTTLQFTGVPGYLIETGREFTTKSNIYFMLIEDVTLDSSGNGSGQAVSVETGSNNNVAANTITEQAEPVEEIYTVTNPVPATGGTDRESDDNYKKRLLQANEGGGKSTANAVISALLNVPGVQSATAVFNKTMAVDADGNPPKSIHAYVLGGTKEDIAEALFNSVSGTSQTVGQQEVTVTDISGYDHVVRFDYAEEVPIYVRLTIKTNAKFEADGIEQLKNKIVEKIGGVDSDGIIQNGLEMGQTVVISQLYNAVYQVNGLDDVTIEIGTDSTNLGTSNILIAQRQVARASFDNIEVIISA